MTRNEAKENLIRIDDKIYGNCRNTAMDAIDKIYDYFESRTCGNCIHAEEDDESDYYCIKHYEHVNFYMSCIQWEPKDE